MGLTTTFTLPLHAELSLLDISLSLDEKIELRIRELRLGENGDITGEGVFVHLPTQWRKETRITPRGRRRRRVPVDQVETACSFRCYISRDGDWVVEVTLQD